MRKYIYTIEGRLLDRVVKDYVDYMTNPLSRHRQDRDEFDSLFCSDGNDDDIVPAPTPLKVDKYTGETVIFNEHRPDESTARAKIQMIGDILYRASLGKEDGVFNVRSTVLKKVSDKYKYMLHVMSMNHIVSITRTYTEDNKYNKTLYSLCDLKQFHHMRVSPSIKKEVERYDKWLEKKREESIKELIAATSPQFVERYNKSLRKLTIDEASAFEYISTQYATDTHSARSREYVVRKISQKQDIELSAIDDSGRLYHIGTQIQRDIKKFTNIRYSLDCKNSHPYLLTNILLYYIVSDGQLDIARNELGRKDISFLFYNLTKYLLDNGGIYVHYVFSDAIYKSLEQSKLKKHEVAKVHSLMERFQTVQDDVWRYIYDAASGQVWDMFEHDFNEDRTVVKQKIFASVVYSYAKRRNKKKESEDKWLRAFIARYPSVYDCIVKIKRDIHEQCKVSGRIRKLNTPISFEINEYCTIEISTKDEVLLPTIMMSLESEIFTEILRRLFNKRISCFGIHDAVVVLDEKKLSVEDIKNIMMDVYKSYGMLPTLSVERYSEG